MKSKIYSVSIAIIILLSFTACQTKESVNTPSNTSYYTFTDDLGNTVKLEKKPSKVISLLGSYGEMWLQAGGELVGVTEDAVSERKLNLSDDISIIGTVKEPNAELVLSLNPEFVILSTDVKSHLSLDDTLEKAGIPHGYFKEETTADYLRVFGIFTDITERKDMYKKYGEDVIAQIDSIKASIPENMKSPKVLLIRSMSTKAKALKDDHMVGIMLKDLKATNIATKHESLLEDLSMETIIQEDPDVILVVTMGNVDKAIETLENGIMKNPAWSNLTAVKNDNYHILPKELFQYKPNARWGESYEYLKEILYP